MSLTTWDLETCLMGPENVAPQIICGGFLTNSSEVTDLNIYGNNSASQLDEAIARALANTSILHNAAFDLSCVIAHGKNFNTASFKFIPLVFEAIRAGRVHCTKIREKLLALATHGKLKKIELPDGSTRMLSFSLDNIAFERLGISLDKSQDSWRLRYSELNGERAVNYPPDALRYLAEDVINTRHIFDSQEIDRQELIEKGIDPFEVEEFRVAADLALRLISCHGFAIDQRRRDLIKAEVMEQVTGSAIEPLIEAGILRAAKPPQVYKTNLRRARKILGLGGDDPINGHLSENQIHQLTSEGVKFTKGQDPTKDMGKLRTLVESACAALNIPVETTPTGEIKTSEGILLQVASASPTLMSYQSFAKLQKLYTTELPRIEAPIVHPDFDVLKETGRSSSYASKLYPSCNIQNVDPRVRECYIPREHKLLCSSDYGGLELVSLAQKNYSLFGKSKMRDLLLQGIDLHAYLGAQLAYHLDPGFKSVCKKMDLRAAGIFKAFQDMKTCDNPSLQQMYRHYRTFAKPTGLGYPGGLGPATFIDFAFATYGISVDEETAIKLKNIWLDTFPEMRLYFEWVNTSCADNRNTDKYAYFSPLGMYRAGASYCAACNGAAMQTPAAEGALLATAMVVEACINPDNKYGILYDYGCRVVAFIHDELIVEVPEGRIAAHEAAKEIGRLMISGMKAVLPEVPVKVESALMHRWNKKAEPVFDTEGILTPWQK